jgi:regulatory protein
LIEENYLNEERFAIAYAGGKWRIKKWGRVRIRLELKQRKISGYCINKAIASIGEDEYRKVLGSMIKKKYAALKSDQYIIRKKKTFNYCIARGYEPALISELFPAS